MTRISESIHIDKDPDALWHEIGSFAAIGHWHPMLTRVKADGEQPGAVRTAESLDGTQQVERLVEMSDEDRMYRYKIESTPIAVRDYEGTFEVDEDGSSGSTITWSSQFEVTAKNDEVGVSNSIHFFLRSGLDNLGMMYGDGAKSNSVDAADRRL